MQTVIAKQGTVYQYLSLPSPEEEVLPNIKWGKFEHLFTPAYWASQVWMSDNEGGLYYKLGNTLREEIAVCLLGGHGIPAEIGLATFHHLKKSGVLGDEKAKKEDFLNLLTEPIPYNDKSVRYRFAKQKSSYLASAFSFLVENNELPDDDISFRNALTQIKGIGLKTASWITRNWKDSDRVAILDIHIMRAGQMIGLFDEKDSPEKNYLEIENKLLKFCDAIGFSPSKTDTIIWEHMKYFSFNATNSRFDL